MFFFLPPSDKEWFIPPFLPRAYTFSSLDDYPAHHVVVDGGTETLSTVALIMRSALKM